MEGAARVIELIRRKMSSEWVDARDVDISEVLQVSKAAVWRYKAGQSAMGPDVLARALRFLDLPANEALNITAECQAELAKDADLARVWRALADMTRGKVAAVTLVASSAIGAAAMPAPSTTSAPSAPMQFARNVY